MMTESEVTSIDDWSFKHRIRSRGEAIRRLVQIGLVFDENRKKLLDKYKDSSDDVFDLMRIAQTLTESRDIKNLTEGERALIRGIYKAVVTSASLLPVIRTTTGLANNFKGDGDLSQIIAEAKEILAIDEDLPEAVEPKNG